LTVKPSGNTTLVSFNWDWAVPSALVNPSSWKSRFTFKPDGEEAEVLVGSAVNDGAKDSWLQPSRPSSAGLVATDSTFEGSAQESIVVESTRGPVQEVGRSGTPAGGRRRCSDR